MMTPQEKFYTEMMMQHSQILATLAVAYAQMGYESDAIFLVNTARTNSLAALGRAHDHVYLAGERIDNPT